MANYDLKMAILIILNNPELESREKNFQVEKLVLNSDNITIII